MNAFKLALVSGALVAAAAAQASPVVTANTNAVALATALGGSGITISNASFSTNGSSNIAGTFTNGGSAVGFDSGVLLTTGDILCGSGTNTSDSCSDPSGSFSSLKFDFTSDTGKVFFQYVFASEEYNEFVGSSFNDTFELLLNGSNIALVPGGGGVVSINNVNCGSNSAYYRNNRNDVAGCAFANLDFQFDGATVVMTASATVAAGSTNTFEFKVSDVGDSALDSGVYIKAGSFSVDNPIPEPASLALVGLGLAAAGLSRRRKA